MALINITLVFMVIAGTFLGGAVDQDGDKQLSLEKKLKDKLFANYDKEVRPVYHHKNETRVEMAFDPIIFIELDEEKALFSIDGWMVLAWADDRLSWNASEYDGLTILRLPDSKVWQPDIMVYNGASSKIDSMKNTHLLLYWTGDIVFVPPIEIQTLCPAATGKTYPNDDVVCDVYFGSWAHDGNQINLTHWESSMSFENFENSNPRWEMLPSLSSVTRHVIHYNCCEEPYITIQASFALKRRYPPELEVIWSPCVLVMALTLTMFWIPPGSGKKILLGSILFLVLSVLTVYVGSATKSPRAPKQAVSFLSSTMYAVASAVVLEVLVINLCSIIGPCRPPSLAVQLLSGPMGRYVAVWPRWPTDVSADQVQLKEDADPQRHPTPQEEWHLVAAVVDRVLFLLYIIVLGAIHQA